MSQEKLEIVSFTLQYFIKDALATLKKKYLIPLVR